MNVTEQLKQIKAGENYPSSVTITEKVKGKQTVLRFFLQSYFVGMYCALYLPDQQLPMQLGDHNNKKFVNSLVKDIKKAIARGAKVEIGSIVPVKKS